MQSRWRAQKCPFFLAAGSIAQLPLLRKVQRGARRPNSRGRLGLNKTPMTRVTRALVPPLGFRIICRRPHHQLLNVKQNPPIHQNRPGVVPCRKSKKINKNLPPPPKTGGGTPPSGAKKMRRTPLKKNQEKERKAYIAGKGMMAPYVEYDRFDGEKMPARLSDDEIREVASYVSEQAKTNWGK